MAGNQYRDYIKRSFFKYAISIISLLFVLMGLFLFINVQWISVGSNRKNNALLASILDSQVTSYKEGLEHFSTDYRFWDALKQENTDAATQVNRLLYGFTTSQPIRSTFALTDTEGRIVSSSLFEGNRAIFLNSAVYKSLVEKMQEAPALTHTMPSRLNFAHGQAGDLLLAHSLADADGICGYLFFDLMDEQIYEAVREYPLDDVVITDRYDNLIFAVGRQNADPMEKYPAGKYRMDWQKGNIVKVNNKHYHIHKEALPETYGILFLGLAGILMVIMIPPLTLRITKKNLQAIDELQSSLEEMGRGNMDYRLKSQVFDEFRMLNDAFRNMVIQREELMLHNNELAERKRIMEIKQLEEQFNPHFIFNVLETLRYEIAIDSQKASEMVMAFANLMRYSIYYGSTIVPLQTDVEYINDYLLLQKMRYNRRLNYHIDIPEELMDLRIPKLLLQPVVENSLVHGMKDKHSVSVTITARMEDSTLVLCVEDNGSGISREKLTKLREALKQEDIYREHLGLYNSHRVVRLLYGPSYGLTIESSPGNGTRVSVTLPADMEEDTYV